MRGKLSGQIVQLNVVMAHSIHVVTLFMVWGFGPHKFSLPCGTIYQEYLLAPFSFYQVSDLSRRLINFSAHSIISGFVISSFEEFNFSILILRVMYIPEISVAGWVYV